MGCNSRFEGPNPPVDFACSEEFFLARGQVAAQGIRPQALPAGSSPGHFAPSGTPEHQSSRDTNCPLTRGFRAARTVPCCPPTSGRVVRRATLCCITQTGARRSGNYKFLIDASISCGSMALTKRRYVVARIQVDTTYRPRYNCRGLVPRTGRKPKGSSNGFRHGVFRPAPHVKPRTIQLGNSPSGSPGHAPGGPAGPPVRHALSVTVFAFAPRAR